MSTPMQSLGDSVFRCSSFQAKRRSGCFCFCGIYGFRDLGCLKCLSYFGFVDILRWSSGVLCSMYMCGCLAYLKEMLLVFCVSMWHFRHEFMVFTWFTFVDGALLVC